MCMKLKGGNKCCIPSNGRANGIYRPSSDECPFYKGVVKKYFPIANYNQYLGKKGFISGQSQIKKASFGPIPSTIHFAMMRANISRIIRKTWNTTKKVQCLINHLNIYAWMHNTKKLTFY